MNTRVYTVSFYHEEAIWASIKQPWATVTITHDILQLFSKHLCNVNLGFDWFSIVVMCLFKIAVFIFCHISPFFSFVRFFGLLGLFSHKQS